MIHRKPCAYYYRAVLCTVRTYEQWNETSSELVLYKKRANRRMHQQRLKLAPLCKRFRNDGVDRLKLASLCTKRFRNHGMQM